MTAKYFDINKNGYSIRCKLYSSGVQTVKRAVIFIHGFGGHKDNKSAMRFAEIMTGKWKDTALLTFNLPGHGDDVRKKISLAECDMYISSVIEDTREKFPEAELFCYATSFGGYLTLRHIVLHGSPFEKVALRCPAVSMYTLLTEKIMSGENRELIAKGRSAQVGFDRKVTVTPDFLEELEKADIRTACYDDYALDILIIHGTKDEIVPFDVVEAFAEDNVIEFVPVEAADHRFTDPARMSRANKEVFRFFGMN